MKIDKKFLLLFIVVLLIEILIALFVRDRVIRPYVGDILVVVLMYCFVRIFLVKRIKWLPVWLFLFAAFIEVTQYFELVKLLGLQNNRFFRILLGMTFDWKDILCYFTGCVLLLVVQEGFYYKSSGR